MMKLWNTKGSLQTRDFSVTDHERFRFLRTVPAILTVLLFMITVSATRAWSLQRHSLIPEQTTSHDQAAGVSQDSAPAQEAQPSPIHAPAEEPVHSAATMDAASHTSAAEHAPMPAPTTGHAASTGHAAAPAHPAGQSVPAAAPVQQMAPASPSTAAGQGAAGEHGGVPAAQEETHATEPGPGVHEEVHGEEHAEHGPKLPEISPTPGVTFVETMISIMDQELKGRFLGWRPNDLIIGRFTDNINNYQLGVLEAMRFTTLRLKDSLTRMGDADAYDPDLEQALNLFMNKATLFWFPSAETSYSEAVNHLSNFLQKLQTGQRYFYYRVDNLQSLINVYKDLLGNVNRTLIMAQHKDGSPVSWFETDDYFYYGKGVAHVLYEILRVVRVGFKDQLVTLDAIDIVDEALHELHVAEGLDPWIILNSDLNSIFANHRANLNAPLSEVAHLLTVMSRF